MASSMASSSASSIEIREPRTPREWEEYYALRYRVLRQPWGAPPGSERDELEDCAIHHIAVDTASGRIIGCGRIHKRDETTAQIRFMAVDPAWQGRGIGRMLLNSLEQWAAGEGCTTIVLYARRSAEGFYHRHGYRTIAPAHTLFGAIEHVLMQKQLR